MEQTIVTGQWADFATGDKGGDLIGLYAYLHRLKNGQAARELAKKLGIADSQSPRREKLYKSTTADEWLPLVPIPPHASPLPVAHPTLGKPSMTWCYRDAQSATLLYVYRFDVTKSGRPDKEFRPLTWCRNNTTAKLAWRWQELKKPWPLYNLDKLAANPSATVVVCEGEKATDAAVVLFPLPNYVTTTSLHGSQSPEQSDWTPLTGRHVIQWPDNDQSGRQYANVVAKLLREVGVASIQELRLEAFSRSMNFPKGWDAADAVAEGWTAEAVRERILSDPANFIASLPPAVPITLPAPLVDDWPRLVADDKPPHLTTDQANGYRLAHRIGHDLTYIINMGWHVWTGTHWQRGDEYAYRRASILSRLILAEAAECTSKDTFKDLVRWALQSESRSRVEAAMFFAKNMLALDNRELDANPWLLTCQNGTVDLKTGELDPHRRNDFITRCIPVDYDPAATCSIWLAFLDWIFAGNTELIRFLQRASGYALTGDISEQCIFILYGSGQNGKSTFIVALQTLLGAYAQQAAPDLLLAHQHDRHPTELAELRGARLVTSVETGESRRLNENLVKQMSGGDRMRGRFMRRDFFEFDPTHKVFLATNHKPVIRGTDFAIWRRIRLIPFTVTIPPEERDPHLSEKLKAELPGILAWCVRGCLAWQREGLQPPREVTEATDAYRQQMDLLAVFFDECCVIDRCAIVAKGALYKAYQEWCEQTGENAETQRKFSERLQERGLTEDRQGIARTRVWRGIGLLDNHADVTDVTDVTDANFHISKQEN